MNDAREKIVATLQRDRLSEFLKRSNEEESGCFYYSLFMIWNKLYPNKVLKQSTVDQLLESETNLRVAPDTIIDRLKRYDSEFGLRVTRVDIPNHISQDVEEIRQDFTIPREIEVVKYNKDETNLRPLNANSSAVICWQHPEGGCHYTSLDESLRFDGLEKERGNVGGQLGVNLLKDAGFSIVLIFHIEKTK